ncbi:hypothetical protein BC939DRAFT_495611 [Gamsiella multidivaricata]|uniref:uncharacterized protein n=1 Tax=Gamsiella multidivaricata TaxID=101098 RepID=UPI002220C347|nr:uncharacterized protein BC939DRAFT_495611 [Gamsiella multidivaricata]KAI7818950.1 hypothetical protein BC939DRAFT_495611 [Gamsiella multidivaricata]
MPPLLRWCLVADVDRFSLFAFRFFLSFLCFQTSPHFQAHPFTMILGFWGLTVFPEKTYTQIVEDSFKLSMAALDEETKPGRSSIRVTINNKTFILCSLIADQIEQQNLDLVFTEGEEISFSVSGDNAVHLSGNYLPEDEGMDYDEEDIEGNMDDEDEDDEDDDEDEEDEAIRILMAKGAKRIADFDGDEEDDDDSEEDPDFTGEDDEDEDEDSDDEDNDGDDDNEQRENDDEDDSDSDEDEDEEEEEEEEVPTVKKQLVVEPVPPPAKKQKVAEEKAVPVKAKEEHRKKEEPKDKEEPKKKEEGKKDNIKTLPNGLIIEDVKVGNGARAKAGKKIGMRYIGRLTNGKVFDKNTSGKPFQFNLGRGEVIKGWDLGIQGMQLGGERRLTIPSTLAYGEKGAPPSIPRNATLVFEVKLVTLK